MFVDQGGGYSYAVHFDWFYLVPAQVLDSYAVHFDWFYLVPAQDDGLPCIPF